MNIEFRHGPKDGSRRFLPLGELSSTIIIEVDGIDHLYRRTSRLTVDGCTVYQYIAIVAAMLVA